MKLLTNSLGRIITVIASVALVISVVALSAAPVSDFFGDVVDKETGYTQDLMDSFGEPFNKPAGSGSGSGAGGSIENNGVVPAGGVYTVKSTGQVLNGGDPLPAVLRSGDTLEYQDITYTLSGVTVTETVIGDYAHATLEDLYAAREALKNSWTSGMGMTWEEILEMDGAAGLSEEEVWEFYDKSEYDDAHNLTLNDVGTSTIEVEIDDSEACWTANADYAVYTTAKLLSSAPVYNSVMGYTVVKSFPTTDTIADTLPDGATYIVYSTGERLEAGSAFPELSSGDIVTYYNYKYTENNGGWRVSINTDFTDKDQSSYGPICKSINGRPITNMNQTFYNCASLTTAPEIPSTVTSMIETFSGCRLLTTVPELPNDVTSLHQTFYGCQSLVSVPNLPDSATTMYQTFYNCSFLTTVPAIPSKVTDMTRTFYNCSSLAIAPDMSKVNSLTRLESTFYNCSSLTDLSKFVIPESVTEMSGVFQKCTSLADLSKFVIPESVTEMPSVFKGCTSLTTAPVIPSSVRNLYYTFQDCTSLTGTITIKITSDANMNGVGGCFSGTTKSITLTGTTWTALLNSLAATSSKGNVTVQQ